MIDKNKEIGLLIDKINDKDIHFAYGHINEEIEALNLQQYILVSLRVTDIIDKYLLTIKNPMIFELWLNKDYKLKHFFYQEGEPEEHFSITGLDGLLSIYQDYSHLLLDSTFGQNLGFKATVYPKSSIKDELLKNILGDEIYNIYQANFMKKKLDDNLPHKNTSKGMKI